MNLVQINERLKDLPMQVVQQYANGMNPEVPPYLALGELQRRELSQKQMATAQGAQQGPQPSVKEQVEQKAGLMALQQMQQQQMAQQQAQPRGPMPAPAGVPQPQQQPEVMMARGGLASIPVRSDMFEYAGGGIIAFQEGGQPKYETPYDRMNRENREAAERRRLEREQFNRELRDDPKQKEMLEAKREFDALSPSEKSSERGQRLKEFFRNVFTSAPAAVAQAPMDALPSKAVAPANPADFMGSPVPTTGLPAALTGATGATGQKPPAPPRPTAQAPAAMPPAAPAGLPGAAAAMTPQDEVAKLSMEAVREKAKAMTPEEAMAQEGKFASQYGLDKKFGEEERGLLALMKQRQAEFAKRRPMEELGATLRGFGQGYGGASAAGERAGRETYEMDMANQREALNAINALNKENLATGKARYASSGSLFGESQKSAAAANQQRTQTLGQMRGQDITAAESAANRLNNLEVENLRNAERRAERTQPGSAAMVRAEYLSMMDQVFALEDKGEKDKADALRRRAEARLATGGASGAGEENAATRSLRTALEAVNKRLEIMGSDDPDYLKLKKQQKDISDQLVNRALGREGGDKPITKAEYEKLPKGATYIAPDGTQRTKG